MEFESTAIKSNGFYALRLCAFCYQLPDTNSGRNIARALKCFTHFFLIGTRTGDYPVRRRSNYLCIDVARCTMNAQTMRTQLPDLCAYAQCATLTCETFFHGTTSSSPLYEPIVLWRI